jgi:DNA-binding CsgD family transcriptional regulator
MSPEVARRVIQLFRFKTAAAETSVSPRTVAWHMRRTHDKLHVHSKSEAIAKVCATGSSDRRLSVQIVVDRR